MDTRQPMYFQWHALNSVKLWQYRREISTRAPPIFQPSFCIKNYVLPFRLLFHQLQRKRCALKYFLSEEAVNRARYGMILSRRVLFSTLI